MMLQIFRLDPPLPLYDIIKVRSHSKPKSSNQCFISSRKCEEKIDPLSSGQSESENEGTSSSDPNTKYETKVYECHVCSLKFSTISLLERHRLIHTATQRHFCNFCKKSFAQLRYLRDHKSRVHNIKTKRNPCPCCQVSDFFVDKFEKTELIKISLFSSPSDSNQS